MYIMDHNSYSEITPEIFRLANMSKQADIIDTELFTKYDVKRGLRDLNGKGVLAGLTHISDVRANKIVDGIQVPTHGRLFYRGYDVKDLVNGFAKDNHFGSLISFRMKRNWKRSNHFWPVTVPFLPVLYAISL